MTISKNNEKLSLEDQKRAYKCEFRKQRNLLARKNIPAQEKYEILTRTFSDRLLLGDLKLRSEEK